MSSESADAATPPNWLNELEERRAKKLNALRLGHEAGAGSACLECKDKCPGLDLHFWRKICKLCKCGKENHGVFDDDAVSGWVQFHLLGHKSTPRRNPHILQLPNRPQDKLELDWSPKGSRDAVERYLRALPEDRLPIKGSPAAKERKHLLQKQVPMHDMDPALCHALSQEEVRLMNDYVHHLQKSCAGVGQLASIARRVQKPTKHDYENIDAFGNHKLAASLEALLRQRIQMEHSEDVESPNRAQYAALLKSQEVEDNVKDEIILDKQKPCYAVFLNSDRIVCRDTLGHPITARLDHLYLPIMDAEVVEALDHCVPSSAILLNAHGQAMCSQNFNAQREKLVDKFENELQPGSGLLMDEQEASMRDATGSPIKVPLDAYLRPIYDASAQEKLDGRQPEYVMFLDRQGGPILDKYGSPIKNIASSHIQPLAAPQYAVIFDEDKKPLTDKHGVPVQMQVDVLGRPVDLPNIPNAAYTMQNGVLQPITYLHAPRSAVGQSQTGIARPCWSRSLQMQDTLPPVVDKYGNIVDPNTGRPIDPLPQFGALSLRPPIEDVQNPTKVNIGLIHDIPATSTYYDDSPANIIKDQTLADGQCDSIDSMQCHRCKKVFEDNALVIEIERSDARWHTECFRCAGCNQPLQDMLYCFHRDSDDVYCARDYAKMRGVPRCHACDELIFVKEYCLAESMTYHIKHFSCFECDTPLADKDYLLLENNQPTCLQCFHLLKADVCLGCRQIIAANEQGLRLQAGEHFHARDECFACVRCAKPLLGAKFLFRQRQLFCSSACYNTS